MKHKILMTLALLITAVGGAWAAEETLLTTLTFGGSSTYSETKSGVVSVTATNVSEYDDDYGWIWDKSGSLSVTALEGYTITRCVFIQNAKTPIEDTEAPFEIHGSFDGIIEDKNGWMDGVTSIEVYGIDPNAIDVTEPDVDVTLNEAKTEASFDMPTFDTDVDYELVRDMTVAVSAEMPSRVRIQKDNNVFVPVTASEMLPTVTDGIDEQNPATMTSATDYTLQLQKEGENNSWTDVTELSVGIFRYVVTGVGLYDGVMYTNTFKLFEGYEIDVPAGEYVTYYKDEALKVEDENAKLYTITAVSGTTATATELTVAPANTPLLVKNNAAETKTILLIPTTTDTPDNVEVYSGFKGTLKATELAGSTDTQANYVCTGKQFTWVKDAGTIAANRCWLELVSSTGAPVLDIVFDGNATGIDATKFTDDANDAWYDLNGRRLQAKPTTKGVYILNGRKVVVK